MGAGTHPVVGDRRCRCRLLGCRGHGKALRHLEGRSAVHADAPSPLIHSVADLLQVRRRRTGSHCHVARYALAISAQRNAGRRTGAAHLSCSIHSAVGRRARQGGFPWLTLPITPTNWSWLASTASWRRARRWPSASPRKTREDCGEPHSPGAPPGGTGLQSLHRLPGPPRAPLNRPHAEPSRAVKGDTTVIKAIDEMLKLWAEGNRRARQQRRRLRRRQPDRHADRQQGRGGPRPPWQPGDPRPCGGGRSPGESPTRGTEERGGGALSQSRQLPRAEVPPLRLQPQHLLSAPACGAPGYPGRPAAAGGLEFLDWIPCPPWNFPTGLRAGFFMPVAHGGGEPPCTAADPAR